MQYKIKQKLKMKLSVRLYRTNLVKYQTPSKLQTLMQNLSQKEKITLKENYKNARANYQKA